MKAITGRDNIHDARTLTLTKALELEIDTGLQHSKLNVLKIARTHLKKFGVEPARTKKDVVAQLKQIGPS